MLLQSLLPHKKQIERQPNPLDILYNYYKNGFIEKLGGNIIFEKDLKQFDQIFKGNISRRKIFELINNKKILEDQPRLLFMSIIIWGSLEIYEGEINPKAITQLEKMFSSQGQIERVVSLTSKPLMNGDITDAYRKFTLSQCGIQYISKYFYFLTYNHLDKYAIILDGRILKSLTFLSLDKSDQDLINIIMPIFNSRYPSYQSYINFMHRIAKKISCETYELEYYLKTSKLD